MGAPYTQVEIQSEIDFYKAAMRNAATSQEYSYDQGPAGQFGVKKGKLKEIQESLNYWLGLMEKYYPDAYSTTPQIYTSEVGYING